MGFLMMFCPKEETFHFLENVLTEVMQLFPSKLSILVVMKHLKHNGKPTKLLKGSYQKEGLKDEHELQNILSKELKNF